jgi:predicted anti-sigma-YlaC factor YlaD
MDDVKRILLLAALAVPAAMGCSPRSAATRLVANAISSSSSGSVYARDDDPELIRAAVPFGLKTMEGLLEEQPEHQGLLTALAAGFTQYSYAFVQFDADAAELDGKMVQAQQGRERAKRLYLRARDYGLRGLELRHPGIGAALRRARDLEPALAPLKKEDVPLVYWTAASWAAAIGVGKGDMALVAELPIPGALMERALAIDESWNEGAIHEFLVTWDAANGDPQSLHQAKDHLDRALALSKGKKLSPIVSYAEAVLVAKQDRAEFTRLLQQVVSADVEVDKANRLANILAQRRAKLLLSHADDLFV